MAKKDLIPVRSSEEAKKRGRNGGIRSGEVRRAKKTMKEAAKMLMEMPVVYESVAKGMKQLKIGQEDMTNQMAIIVSMYKEAMSGNVKAAQFLRDIISDEQTDKERKERFEMEKERFQLEKRRIEKQLAESGNTDDDMPVIINVRPEE